MFLSTSLLRMTAKPPPPPPKPVRTEPPKPVPAVPYEPHRWPEIHTDAAAGTPVRYGGTIVGAVLAGVAVVSGTSDAAVIARRLIREAVLTVLTADGELH